MQDVAAKEAVAVFTSCQEDALTKHLERAKGTAPAFPSSHSHSYHTSEEHTALECLSNKAVQ